MNNYSRQREVILNTIKESNMHPTAEEIYNQVNAIDSKISKSTVYRNISILVENNIIKEIPTPQGIKRFDYIKKPHSHIICEKCGEIFDFMYEFDAENLIQEVKNQVMVETNLDSITIYGICNNCKSKNKNI